MRETWKQVALIGVKSTSFAVTKILHVLLFSDTVLISSWILQKYQHYITTGIPGYVLSSLPQQQLKKILRLLPPDTEHSSKNLPTVRADIQEEVKRDYHLSMKKSIGEKPPQENKSFDLKMFCSGSSFDFVPWSVDYVLMDPLERLRLSISSVPKSFPWRVIRAPVPWMLSYQEAHLWQSQHLFSASPIMVLLQEVWLNRWDRDLHICISLYIYI